MISSACRKTRILRIEFRAAMRIELRPSLGRPFGSATVGEFCATRLSIAFSAWSFADCEPKVCIMNLSSFRDSPQAEPAPFLPIRAIDRGGLLIHPDLFGHMNLLLSA